MNHFILCTDKILLYLLNELEGQIRSDKNSLHTKKKLPDNCGPHRDSLCGATDHKKVGGQFHILFWYTLDNNKTIVVFRYLFVKKRDIKKSTVKNFSCWHIFVSKNKLTSFSARATFIGQREKNYQESRLVLPHPTCPCLLFL